MLHPNSIIKISLQYNNNIFTKKHLEKIKMFRYYICCAYDKYDDEKDEEVLHIDDGYPLFNDYELLS